MKMTERLIAAINEQINKELYSAYLYRSMAMDTRWCDQLAQPAVSRGDGTR